MNRQSSGACRSGLGAPLAFRPESNARSFAVVALQDGRAPGLDDDLPGGLAASTAWIFLVRWLMVTTARLFFRAGIAP